MSGRDGNGQRTAILGRVRRSLGRKSDEAGRLIEQEAVSARLAANERGIIPERAQVSSSEQIDMFMDYARGVSSTVERVGSYDDLPGAIAIYLRGKNLPLSVRSGEDPRLAAIDWSLEASLERHIGPSDGSDLVGLSHAMGGVAETGTAFFRSGPDNPTTLNFLPETHIMVIKADDIVGDYETLQDRLRNSDGEADMPRVLNLITGPSRSGDIEQILLLGAHGPRDVHVIVVG